MAVAGIAPIKAQEYMINTNPTTLFWLFKRDYSEGQHMAYLEEHHNM